MKNVFGISVSSVAASLCDAWRGPQGRGYNYTFTFFQTPPSCLQL